MVSSKSEICWRNMTNLSKHLAKSIAYIVVLDTKASNGFPNKRNTEIFSVRLLSVKCGFHTNSFTVRITCLRTDKYIIRLFNNLSFCHVRLHASVWHSVESAIVILLFEPNSKIVSKCNTANFMVDYTWPAIASYLSCSSIWRLSYEEIISGFAIITKSQLVIQNNSNNTFKMLNRDKVLIYRHNRLFLWWESFLCVAYFFEIAVQLIGFLIYEADT